MPSNTCSWPSGSHRCNGAERNRCVGEGRQLSAVDEGAAREVGNSRQFLSYKISRLTA